MVLNSGFTFREFDYLNNARQIPKLPDYAVVDTTTPPGPRYPGKIVQAGFFNEDLGAPMRKSPTNRAAMFALLALPRVLCTLR